MKKKLLLSIAALVAVSFFNASAKQKYFPTETDSNKSSIKLEKRTYVATHTSLPPEIDGVFNDSCWNKENWHDFQYQKEPVDAGTPTEETYFKIVYDEDNIYAAVRAYDKEPGKISRILSNRDNYAGDLVSVCIDSYFDRRTSFEFGVTAAGSKVDQVVTNGNQMNLNWNPVWDVKVGTEDSAWTAEFRIPLSQLRFSEKDEHTWGFMVWRWIYRKAEEDDWGPNPITSSTWVDKYGDITGIKGINTPSRIELLPYTLGKYHSYKKEEGNPFKTGSDKNLDFGMDGKIGISSAFNLDLTINPDFGQVEADPSQISLSAYELEYEEKRPFFIEGNDILSFPHLYYPRRIGHLPSYNPQLNANEYADMPERTSILGAAKITGKTYGGLSIGILESVTGKESAEIQSPQKKYSTAVEPLTNYFIGRVQKELNDGNFIYGGALTAVNRSINDEHLNFLASSAYTGGFDFTYKWDNKNYSLFGVGLFSHVRGNKNAITKIQQSPVHYFQRPDADYLSLDTNKTNLTGYAAAIEFKKSGGDNWRFSELVKMYSPNLEINDLGYISTVDRIYQTSEAGYVVQTPSGILRNYSFYLGQNSEWNFGGDNYEIEAWFNTNFTFVNRWYINTELYRNFSALDPSLIWGGPLFKKEGSWNYEIEFGSDYTKPFSFSVDFESEYKDDEISTMYEISPSFTYRITNAFSFSGNIFYEFTRNNLQYVSTEQRGRNNYYFLGKVDQDVLGITARISFYLTPDLSIQYYGSPFSATRKYSAIKKVTDPRAKNYNDRFHEFTPGEVVFHEKFNSYEINDNGTLFAISNPDMSFREFRSNLVVKWEYNPGSTIYVVWSQNRSGLTGYESTSFGKAVNRIFDIYPDNILMIKINHWFSL